MLAPLLTREQSRAVDSIAIERYGIPGMVLMENAGRGVVDVLLDVAERCVSPTVAIVCGKGNNAGDGFVIARHLQIRGAQPKVFLLAPPEQLHGDALQNYNILCQTTIPRFDLSVEQELIAALNAEAADADWYVDAMLGTGAVGAPREPYRTAITWLNQQSGKRLAVDVPSGLDCETGAPAAATFCADITGAFVAAKVGFAAEQAAAFLGQLHVISIGIPPQLLAEVQSS